MKSDQVIKVIELYNKALTKELTAKDIEDVNLITFRFNDIKVEASNGSVMEPSELYIVFPNKKVTLSEFVANREQQEFDKLRSGMKLLLAIHGNGVGRIKVRNILKEVFK